MTTGRIQSIADVKALIAMRLARHREKLELPTQTEQQTAFLRGQIAQLKDLSECLANEPQPEWTEPAFI